VGPGPPPSASEAVDIAKVNRIAATNRRAIFFISVSPSIKSEVPTCWGNTTCVSRKRNTCSKSARFRCRASYCDWCLLSLDAPYRITVGKPTTGRPAALLSCTGVYGQACKDHEIIGVAGGCNFADVVGKATGVACVLGPTLGGYAAASESLNSEFAMSWYRSRACWTLLLESD
jgi:hypothetical protein